MESMLESESETVRIEEDCTESAIVRESELSAAEETAVAVDPTISDPEVVQQETVSYPEYQCGNPWTPICGSFKEFANKSKPCFLKGCKWSPDGTCLLTCAEDGFLRLFDLPADLYNSHNKSYQGCSMAELSPSLRIKEGEIIYDYTWHPHMSSWQSETCLLASTSKGSPTHMWDAYKGTLVATYRSYDNVDEVESANSLCISPDGLKLYCGFDRCVRVFDVDIPGRSFQTRPTKSPDGISASQSGIISCIAVNPALPTVYAAASYMKTIGLYSEPDGTALCVLEGHRGGVTHLKFSPDGFVLYSGGRKDPEIICWDLRNPGKVLFTMTRTVETNQRIYFDLDPSGRYLITGDTSGCVSVWDTQKGLIAPDENSESISILPAEMVQQRMHQDCINGISCHPWLPVVATSSGQRHLTHLNSDDDSSCEDSSSETVDTDYSAATTTTKPENTVKLWWAGQLTGEIPCSEI